jgi:hypothetical protein
LPSSTALAHLEASATARRSLGPVIATALGCVLLATASRAEPGDRAEGGAEQPPSSGERLTATAKVVLIGAAAADTELPLLFRELLGRKGVTVEIDRATRFAQDELLESDAPESIRVFVVLDEPTRARLRFRGPDGERYLLRTVTLAGGLDAVGRELLGQVVESSVVALLHSTEGMSRKEVTAALERDDAGDAKPPAPAAPTPASTAGPDRRRPSAGRPAADWEPRILARYALSGTELGASHGPGFGAGLRRRAMMWSLGLELGADLRFPQLLSTPALDAKLDLTTFHALVELGLVPSPVRGVFVAVGPALERSRTRTLSTTAGVTAASATTALRPGVRAEVRYELGAGHLLLGVAAVLEASLVKTRYALAQPGAPELLAAPSPGRAGGAVTLGLRP